MEKAIPQHITPKGITAKVGKKLSDVKLPKGFAWMDDTIILDELGEKTYKAKFIPEDTLNYRIIEDIDVTIIIREPNSEIEDNIPIEGIVIDKGNIQQYLLKDNILNLSVQYIPEDTNVDKSIIWESDNNEIATVDNNGRITGISRGSANIIAKSKFNETVIASIEVIIYEDIKGDIDNNGIVNIFDAYVFLQQLSRLTSINDTFYTMTNADMDFNKRIDIFDVYELLKRLSETV